jgi:uncharacterized membrane protein
MLIEEQYPNTLNASGSTRCWLQAAAVSLVTAVLVAAPFFRLGIMVGHDFAFHMTSWMDVFRQWKEGIHYPRWTEWANGGYGEPRFLFYPPLSWLLGAALGLVAPWKDVQGLFVVVAQAFAGLSMFAFARRFLSQRGALLAAMAYGANPYIFLDVYMRSAFAEQLACAVMPLVVPAALELAGLIESRGRSPWQAVAFFAIPFSVVWLANVPSGVMESYSVVLIFAWAALAKRRTIWSLGGQILGQPEPIHNPGDSAAA